MTGGCARREHLRWFCAEYCTGSCVCERNCEDHYSRWGNGWEVYSKNSNDITCASLFFSIYTCFHLDCLFSFIFYCFATSPENINTYVYIFCSLFLKFFNHLFLTPFFSISANKRVFFIFLKIFFFWTLFSLQGQMDAYKKREVIMPRLTNFVRTNNITLITISHDLVSYFLFFTCFFSFAFFLRFFLVTVFVIYEP